LLSIMVPGGRLRGILDSVAHQGPHRDAVVAAGVVDRVVDRLRATEALVPGPRGPPFLSQVPPVRRGPNPPLSSPRRGTQPPGPPAATAAAFVLRGFAAAPDTAAFVMAAGAPDPLVGVLRQGQTAGTRSRECSEVRGHRVVDPGGGYTSPV